MPATKTCHPERSEGSIQTGMSESLKLEGQIHWIAPVPLGSSLASALSADASNKGTPSPYLGKGRGDCYVALNLQMQVWRIRGFKDNDSKRGNSYPD